MGTLLTYVYQYYWLELILQGYCIFHCIRRGTQQKWLWVIVLLPLVGSLVYIYTEILQHRNIGSVANNVGAVLNPGGRIKRLEDKLKFSDTFANRMALADAYLEAKLYDKAIPLYEDTLTGVFGSSEGGIKNLIQAYYKTGQYDKAAELGPRVVNTLDFSKTPYNLYYALSLEQLNRMQEAESEFKRMNHRFINYEARYNYGRFLAEQGRRDEARQVFNVVLEEAQHLSNREKGSSAEWINLIRKESKKLDETVVS